MKKVLIALMLVFMLCLALAGCGSNNSPKAEPAKKIKIVTTIFPAYDWTRQIIGKDNKNIELILLNTTGADLHSYKPTVEDIAKISTCDMLIYVGGESEEWVKKAAGEAQNKKLKAINLLDTLGKNAKVEQVVEGMQGEEHKDHEHGDDKHNHKDDKHHDHKDDHKDDKHHDHKHHDHKDDHKDDKHHDHKDDHKDDKHHDHKHVEEEPEYDEHVWLSLRNAQQFVTVIEKNVSEIDAKNQDVYAKNARGYITQLKALDDNYKKAVGEAKFKTVLFADRFPFRYLVDDYSLKYYAAFVGCSAETEASFKTIRFLADKVDDLGLNVVLKIEKSSDKIAKTVIDNTKQKNAKIVEMHSLQAVSADDISKGASYLKVMESNLSALQKALK